MFLDPSRLEILFNAHLLNYFLRPSANTKAVGLLVVLVAVVRLLVPFLI